MSDIIEQTLESVEFISDPDFEDFVVSDREARRIANQLIGEHRV
jgi:1-deoxy-D-xylulose-5-phosphate reductoisomerase